MTAALAAILLALVWVAVTGSFTPVNLLFGLILAAFSLAVVRGERRGRLRPFRPYRLLRLAGLFLLELILSGVRVARLVLSPRMELKPGIFAFPLTVRGDFEITLLANMITLTPGTLSVDVSEDRRTLYVHAIDSSDPDAARRDIARGFERRIREAFE